MEATFGLGTVSVHRLGFGAMRVTGPGIWGPPHDHGQAIRVLRRAVELGVDLIDTADSYGPYVSEELIREALHPYPDGLVIATKAGLVRTGPDEWHPVGRPEYIRQECEMSLRRLGVEALDLFQLHEPDPQVPLQDEIGVFADLQKEGKVRLVGVSNVTLDQLEVCRQGAEVVSVQNIYNVTDRRHEDVLEHCAAQGIGFIPYDPLASGRLAGPRSPLAGLARRLGATPAQVGLAWLLHRSPVLLPIPGTSTVDHLEENMAALDIDLRGDDYEELDTLVRTS